MSLHILALYADAHTVSSTMGPGLGLRPGLHAEGDPTKGNPLDRQIRAAPVKLGTAKWARGPLGTPTEQQGPQHPHGTPVAHSRKASVTHWTLALTKPHGSAP